MKRLYYQRPRGMFISANDRGRIAKVLENWPYRAGIIELGTPSGEVLLGETNIAQIGELLYGRYLFLFESAGIILLVAMIGAIVLTHRPTKTTRGHQDIGKQVRRRPEEATVLKQPEVGQGVEL